MTDKRYKIFIQSLQQELPPYLEALRREAEACRVPIIRREMQDLLAVQLALVRPDRILEIGTATGFSALFMAENAPDHAQITTIENYEKRIPVAIEHFDQAGRADQIKLLRGDAQDVLKTLEYPYDFVFMDAAKGQYLNFLPDVLRLLRPGGVLVTDNIFQDGDILESRFLVTRRDRTIHKRMREFLYQLTHSEELKTVLLPIGDGAALSVRNESKGTYHSDSF